ncbi:MAG: fructosamine kinase family protein [Proteobacteria bacterium]|nr:fructosamine kinase family protein [Pseudomonadota bacterium]
MGADALPHAPGLAALLGEPVREMCRVPGGDICDAYRARLESGRDVFVKAHPAAPPRMLAREAEGLRWLADADSLRVPEVLGSSEAERPGPSWLALEWIEPGTPARDWDERTGRGLAHLHRAGAAHFGFADDNYIGSLPQANAPRETWARFYAEQRLAPQVRRARDAGRLDGSVVRRFDALIANMEDRTGPPEPPARLHGDLWRGNVLADEDGRPCLVDPAVYGGHREVDLAMLRLFGGFSPRCFAAYAEAFPLEPGDADRVSLYQLYPLLVHVNLFGGGYASSVAEALSRCL